MRSIRWKIIVLCLVVLVIPIAILSRYTTRIFDEFTRRNLEQQMIDMAFVVGEQFKSMIRADGSLPDERQTDLARVISAYSRQTDSRIEVLSSNGVVLADSATNTSVGTDLSNLPEVGTALGGKYKARYALTPDHKFMFYYIAMPIRLNDKVAGVAHLSRHTNPIVKTIRQMVRFRQIATAAAVVIGIVLATVLAHTITSRLRKLTASTKAFARGETPLKVEVRGRDEIGELAQAINTMAGEIARTNRYNREFVSAVMHELRMPITAIKGAAELLDQGAFEKKEARDKFLANIRFEADRLARLVWELNELTKLDTEGQHTLKEKIGYGACVGEIVERFKTSLDEPHAEITLSLPEKDLLVFLNLGRIEQVICNLLENAVRYTPATGSIAVTVIEGPDGTAITSIKDSGCGILPANIGKIFDKFFTTEPKDKPKDYGSGLGLAIARSIVENHQGRIWVESEPGKGATFSFTLPLSTGKG